MLREAYGHKSMSCAMVFDWHPCFKKVKTSFKSNDHPEKTSTSRNAGMFKKVYSLMKVDKRLTIRELCDQVGISFGHIKLFLLKIWI